jgi:HK97 family phage prohead protease
VASTGVLDRYGEVIEPSGWRLENYRKNPVFLNSHRYGDVTQTLGRAVVTEVREIEGQPALFQRVEFAVGVSPQARIAYGLYRGGFLSAVSVGFIPLKWEDAEAAGPGGRASDRGTGPWRRYTEQELVEVSAVAVPANSEALALGVKSGVVSRADVLEMLDLKPELFGGEWLLRALWAVMRGN